MNFIFVSPDFPNTYYNFCKELKKQGVTVLGISSTPYDQLSQDCRDSLTEYYRVDNMEDYSQMFKAVAFFSFKYGKIDFIESNNEYWLEQDAKLRSDFNIKTGKKIEEMAVFKSKEAMKEAYKKANVPVARYHIPTTLEEGKKFIKLVGYPVVVKPDNGVGAQATYKISSDKELEDFYKVLPKRKYIMEEFINGDLISFDGVVDSHSNPVFFSYEVFPEQAMDIVNELKDDFYYSSKECPKDLEEVGRRVLKAFEPKQRWFHMEFFRLREDHPYLGPKGTICGLEVNMRCPGGYTPDMVNWAHSINSYKIWADIIIKDMTDEAMNLPQFYCATYGRRDGKKYKHSSAEIYDKYMGEIVDHKRMPDILSDDMGNDCWFAKFDTFEQMEEFKKYLSELQ